MAIDSRGDFVAFARYAADPAASRDCADVAIVVADAWQRRGIGSALTAQLIERAGANGFSRLTASTLGDNAAARALLERLGFRVAEVSNGVVSYRRELTASRERAA